MATIGMKLNKIIDKKTLKFISLSFKDFFKIKDTVDEAFDIVSCLTFNSLEEFSGIVDSHFGSMNYQNKLMKQSCAYLLMGLDISKNKNENEIEINCNFPIVVMPAFDIDKVNDISSIIHELLHLVKSYHNTLITTDDYLIKRSGLKYTYSKVIIEDENIYIEEKFVKGLGLEEMFNALEEEDVLKYYLYPEQELPNLEQYKEYIRELYNQKDFFDNLTEAQIYGDKEKLINYFDSMTYNGAYLKLESIIDNIYLNFINNLGEDNKLNEIVKNSDKIYEEELLPLFMMYKEGVIKNAGNSRSRNSKKCLKRKNIK